MRVNAIQLAQSSDIRADILKKAEPHLNAHKVLGDRVLVATYFPPSITAGGIHIPDRKAEEFRFTGIVGLVLKKGPTAFKYDGQYPYEGPEPDVGDWVKISMTNAREFFFGGDDRSGLSCRHVRSELIEAIIDSPASVYPGNGFENL